ncbi:MAG TPA: hypothetical protein IAA05_15775 [Candidatus Blautia excrementipullorum]|nr:hypothetical protein [Candidatus Blautia excrementipullorum]
MRKEKKNRWILVRCLIVTVIFVMLLVFAGKLFIPYYIQDTDQNRTFYKTEKNTVDVLIAGSSTLLVGLSPLELWEDYGIVAHTRASTVQAPQVTWLNIKEAYRYQKPKVVVMGITSLFLDYDYNANEPYLRRGLDFKRLSADKLKAVYEVVKRSDSQHILDYIFPIFRYHDRWKELQWTDIYNLQYRRDFMRGQYPVYRARKIDARDRVNKTVPPEKENTDSWLFYQDAIEYCRSQGSEVIVVNMPDDRWTYGRYQTAKKLTEGCGAAYIDFNLEEPLREMEIDWESDFYDPHHLNPVGAQKTTKYLGDYLVKHYDIPRGQCRESTAELLNKDLREYKIKLKEFEDKLEARKGQEK